MKIFVGNLSFDAVEGDVKKAFEEFGSVASVAIVMDKKGTNSRGFGFVEMLDDQQARAAIAAFDGKDFMGRPLNVSPSIPKAKDEIEKREKKRGRIRDKAQSEESSLRPDSGYSAYKKGRRSRSFMTRRAASGTPVEDRSRIKSHENPMRWRKKSDQPKPWQKSHGEPIPWKGPKPWKKTAGESRPWIRKEGGGGESRPWRKREESPKPWQKTTGESKPWQKSQGESRPWRKSGGESKPWKKREEGSKPWQKTTGESRPWGSSRAGESRRPSQPRSRSRQKPGGYNR